MSNRVWDSYLTEQDKAHLAKSEHRRIGFGERPALRAAAALNAVKNWRMKFIHRYHCTH